MPPTPETFGEPGRQVRGLLYRPREANGRPALLMCPPFGEERKATARVMALAAAGLAEHGYPVLRIDYWGTGESDGWMEQVALTDWQADIRSAGRYVAERTGAEKIGLVGLRFGGTLGVWCGIGDGVLDCLVLWGPQMGGAETIAECRQHLAATRLLAGAVGLNNRGATERNACDMGGFLMSESLQDQIESIRLPGSARAKAKRVVVVQFSHRAEVSRPHGDLCTALTVPEGRGRAFCLPVRPFWVTASRYDPRDLVERTVMALEELDRPDAAGGGTSG